MSVLDPIHFALGGADVSSAKTVLVIQTGFPELLTEAVDRVRAHLPAAAMTVLLQRNMADQVPVREQVEYLENVGSKRALTRQLRNRRFDAVFMLYFNHPGFWKLKLLPFLIGARQVLAINENLVWFPVSLRHAGALAKHMGWRWSGSGSGDSVAMDLAEGLVRAAVRPFMIAGLIVYEKLASLRANTSWKRENRIR
jgi:hypothetical protein